MGYRVLRNLILLAFSVLPVLAAAGIGDIDPAFGRLEGRLVATLSDGRFLFTSPGGYSRANPDGQMDRQFGFQGTHAWPAGFEPGCPPPTPYEASLDPFHVCTFRWVPTHDGKLIIAGSTAGEIAPTTFQTLYGYATRRVAAIMRLHADGTIDTSFGSAGLLVEAAVQEPGNGSFILSAAHEPDGDLLVVVATYNDYIDYYDGPTEVLVYRYLPNGTIDSSFGSGGKTRLWPFGDTAGSFDTTIAVLPDLRIKVSSSRGTATYLNATGERLLAPPDSATPDVFAPNWRIAGRFMDGGYLLETRGLSQSYALARTHADGQIDRTFGNLGTSLAIIDADLASLLLTSTLLNDGSRFIYLQGYDPQRASQVVSRLHATGPNAGMLDRSFGSNGVVAIRSPITNLRAYGLLDDSALVAQEERYFSDAAYLIRLQARIEPSPGAIGLVSVLTAYKEDVGEIRVRVTRFAGLNGSVRVKYRTASGGTITDRNFLPATPGVDYEEAAGQLYWPDGDDSDQFVTIKVMQDSLSEGDEFLTLHLEAVTGGAIIAGVSQQVLQLHDMPGGQAVSPPASNPGPAPTPTATTPTAPVNHGGGGSLDAALLALCLLVLGWLRFVDLRQYWRRTLGRASPIALIANCRSEPTQR